MRKLEEPRAWIVRVNLMKNGDNEIDMVGGVSAEIIFLDLAIE
jgi:hypothetical protein